MAHLAGDNFLSGYRTAAACGLDRAILASMRERRTYIKHGEAFALLYCLYREASKLREHSLL